MNPQTIAIADYDYDLPDARIARYPLPERDASKLLVWNASDIHESAFRRIADELPERTLLVVNDTKVIHARLRFRTATGSMIEVFCLEPLDPPTAEVVFSCRQRCVWKCYVGNNKRWKNGPLSQDATTAERLPFTFRASRLEPIEEAYKIEFSWTGDLPFGQILETLGQIPLPPYLKREAEASDDERYQTIFARYSGSVAAPTASLHFTDRVLASLHSKQIEQTELTLHVGAGTFKPVNSDHIGAHHMHEEALIIKPEFLNRLLAQLHQGDPIIPVGTTAMRSLESLYFLGCQCRLQGPNFSHHVAQWTPYPATTDTLDNELHQWATAKISPQEALQALVDYLKHQHLEHLEATTGIIIAPSYTFRYASGLITNFHQPKSTLLLLIAAIMGDDWRRAYTYALEHDFRFLSYGDACLIKR